VNKEATAFSLIPPKLVKTVLILVLLVLVVIILRYAKGFLIPITFAGLLSMLLLPITTWLQKRKLNKALSALAAVAVFVFLLGGIIALISWQAAGVTDNANKIERRVSDTYKKAQQFISEKLGVPPEKQKQVMKEQQSSAPGKLASTITGLVSDIGSLLANALLVLVYIFLFIYFRAHIKKFVLRLVPGKDEDKTKDIFEKTQKITQKYLAGYGAMIVGLWVMYAIGFSIVGVRSPILFAILCGVLEIVPFVGNLIGNAITIIVTLIQGGGVNVVVGILITYAIVQFIQSYILEPLVVGHEVNINPLFTIVGLIAAEMVWGIAGMVVAIPLMGIAKIIFDHVDSLKPYGEFMGETKKDGDGVRKTFYTLGEKIKSLFQ
jgi:predicted PurR-regulated permease PerM